MVKVIRISLCMIVKNEEDVLARCLDSVKGLTDEIIIVDTGSEDKTVEIAKGYTDKVYFFEWCDDFSAARNFSFEKAEYEYCMWLDADDVIEGENIKEFIKLKNSLDSAADVVMMRYNTRFDVSGNPNFYYYRERIVKKSNKPLWEGAVHEVIVPAGKIFYSEVAVSHKKLRPTLPERNLKIYQVQIQKGKKFNPREKFYYARELYYNGQYKEAVSVFKDFLDENKGWTINNIDACLTLSYCYQNTGENEKRLESLLLSFKYGKPRPEICCNIADCFFKRSKFKEAAFWYSEAINAEIDKTSGEFFNAEFQGYVPYIQLAVCYSKLGNYKLAEFCNEKAGDFRPNDAAVLINREYFKSLKEQNGQPHHNKQD